MCAKERSFEDYFSDDLDKIAGMSDEELERLMGSSTEPPRTETSLEETEPGTRLGGTVIGVQGDEVLVELDGKTVGVVDAGEFEAGELPEPGSSLQAEFVRYDRSKEACVLSIHGVRREITWDELRPGTTVEGLVTDTNKGGLTVDVKGIRAFMPISQIERERVEDPTVYVGRKLTCEVVQVDRSDENLVLSRRAILEREHEALREEALVRIEEGQIVHGRVTRLTEHGAFVDLGGVDGLLHASKIHQRIQTSPGEEPLGVGQHIQVEVVRVDRDLGRVGLDFVRVEEDSWDAIVGNYSEGDEVTGWVSRIEPEGAILTIEEGLEALIPRPADAASDDDLPHTGEIVHGTVRKIDPGTRRIIIRPARSRS